MSSMWVKLDDHFAGHPKIQRLSDAAFRLHVEAMCYAGLHESDGWLPVRVVSHRRRQVAELLHAGLWSKDQEGYQIHDWSDWNGTQEQRQQRREQWREKKRRQRGESPGDSTGDI